MRSCRAREWAVPPEVLWPQIDALEAAIQRQDVEAALDVLAALVPEWTPGAGLKGSGGSKVDDAEQKGSQASLTGIES